MYHPSVVIVLALSAVTLYAGAIGPIGCSGVTGSLVVGSTTYTLTTASGSNSCSLTGTFGSFATTGYVVTVNASTKSDPVIDFGMNFGGDGSDPLVTLKISTPYTGGPYPTIFATASGILSDSSATGSAFALPQSGNDIEAVIVNGSPLVTGSPLNPGCSFSGQTPGFVQPACGPFTSMLISGPFPSSGTLEVDAAFNLSTTGSYNVTGSASLVPEPATAILLAAGLLAMAGLACRRSLG